MNNKIGVGVITCDRQEFFEKCINSIPEVNTLVVVNDGMPYPSNIYPSKIQKLYQHTNNKSVGVSKNEALRYLIQNGCEHLFIIEDDIIIKDSNVFSAYINAANKSGIYHFNFGYHGPANFIPSQYGVPNPRQIVNYGDGIEISFNANCVGAFSYYLKGVIKHVGYMDERFRNAWEHVEHTYRIIKAGLHPPFWWFADISNSMNYLQELANSEVNSTIIKTPEWIRNFQLGALWYQHKHGHIPTKTPDTPPEQVLQILNTIQTNYARTK
jgi:GT2 family glycosyltransferase